jgi:hypothetical protein
LSDFRGTPFVALLFGGFVLAVGSFVNWVSTGSSFAAAIFFLSLSGCIASLLTRFLTAGGSTQAILGIGASVGGAGLGVLAAWVWLRPTAYRHFNGVYPARNFLLVGFMAIATGIFLVALSRSSPKP